MASEAEKMGHYYYLAREGSCAPSAMSFFGSLFTLHLVCKLGNRFQEIICAFIVYLDIVSSPFHM
jgi:hypothetical protein